MRPAGVKRVTLRLGLTTQQALRELWAAMLSSRKTVGLSILLLIIAGPVHGAISCPDAVTHAGDSSNDDIVGTEDADRISTVGGEDTVHAGAGTDCVNGGSFDDHLFGEQDDDRLIGEGGNDLLDGGDGDDELNGGSNNDSLYGRNDDDRLFGEAGDDLLDGGDGDDYLNGGSNNDLLRPGLGQDRVSGQGGDDTIVVHAGDVPAGAEEEIGGDTGNDTLTLDFDPGPVTFPNFEIVDPATNGTYKVTGVEGIIVEICGNGVADPGEECDDDNRTNGDGCDDECHREECENGKDENGECIPDDPSNNEECGGTCDDGDKCTTDRCQSSRCVSTPLPTLDRAICDVNELRANCSLELGKRKRLENKLSKVLRILRLVKAGGSPSRLARANRIIAKVEKRALQMVLKGQTRADCSNAIDIRLVDLSSAVATLQFE
jgi:cysteine-rich repeat protein